MSAESQQLITLIVSIVTLIGVILSQLVPAILRRGELKDQHAADKKTTRIGFLQMQMLDLIAWNYNHGRDNEAPTRILGIILSIDDKEMQTIARTKDKPIDWKAEEGIKRLGEMINAELK